MNATQNTVALPALARHVPRRKPKQLVTIAIGFLCKDAIVLASDSQTADLATGRTNRNVDKIHRLKFSDRNEALVAEAGSEVMSANVIETLNEMAREHTIKESRSVSELTEAALAKLRKDLAAQHGALLQDFLDRNSTELLIANYSKGEPNLFTLDFGIGKSNRPTGGKPYVAIGCGWPIAAYLLDRFDLSNLQLGEALATAIYVVEEVKKTDLRCQGPTKAAYLYSTRIIPRSDLQSEVPPPEPAGGYPIQATGVLLSHTEIKLRVDKLRDFDKGLNEEWHCRLAEMVYGVGKAFP